MLLNYRFPVALLLSISIVFLANNSSMAFVDDKKEAVVNQDQKGESKEDVAAAKSKDGDAKATKPDTPPENEKKGEKGKGEQEKPVEKDDAAPPPPLFPDKALESAVRAVVFEKRFNEEPLTKEDVAKIPHVIGRGKGIKSLKGLEHCVSLMKIDLEGNQIADLKPIAGLTKLISLSLAGNDISDITALEQLKDLQLLDLSRNKIKDLKPVEQMKNLRDLWVAENQINNLDPIRSLPKIWYLDIAKNQVSDLTVVGKLKWLTTLDVTGNKLTDLSALTALEDLDLLLVSKNKISDLGPLVKMCAADASGERRFAPYLEVYLGENPIDPTKKNAWIDALKNAGVDVFDK